MNHFMGLLFNHIKKEKNLTTVPRPKKEVFKGPLGLFEVLTEWPTPDQTFLFSVVSLHKVQHMFSWLRLKT